jgi:hypothetical protein
VQLMTRQEAFDQYWSALCLKGDPLRIPDPFQNAFKAGWEAAENEARKERLEVAREHSREIRDAVAESRRDRREDDYGSF